MHKLSAFFRKMRSSVRSEGAENTITMIIAFPLLWAIIMTVIDFGCYFNNRSLLIQDLRDGARTVAILGGTNNKLVDAYGINVYTMTDCANVGINETDIVKAGHTDPITRAVANKICANHGYIQYSVFDVECNPKTTDKVGKAVWCQASYVYNGMPGSAMSLMGSAYRSVSGKIDNSVTISDGKNSKTITDSGISRKTAIPSESNTLMGWNAGTIRAAAQSETITVE